MNKKKQKPTKQIFWVQPFMSPLIPCKWRHRVSNTPIEGWLKVEFIEFERVGKPEDMIREVS